MSKKKCIFAAAMVQTTPAIVLSSQRYGEHRLILHAYTRTSGRVNYMVYGGLGKRKSQAPFLPMSMVELTANIQPNKDMPTLKESRLIYVPQAMDTDIRRQTVALFVAEMLYRTLRYPQQDEALFDFLTRVLIEIDTAEDIANVHIRFLVHFASQLGLTINEDEHPELLGTPHSRTERQTLLTTLCAYYQSHLDDWQEPKSLAVLQEVFD